MNCIVGARSIRSSSLSLLHARSLKENSFWLDRDIWYHQVSIRKLEDQKTLFGGSESPNRTLQTELLLTESKGGTGPIGEKDIHPGVEQPFHDLGWGWEQDRDVCLGA